MDILILMTAAICHDLDHPGYNNTCVTFRFKGHSVQLNTQTSPTSELSAEASAPPAPPPGDTAPHFGTLPKALGLPGADPARLPNPRRLPHPLGVLAAGGASAPARSPGGA